METLIAESFEACAEVAGDITDDVYTEFFRLCPQASPLMDHSDQYMRGRMLQQTLELLMSDEHLGEESYLSWEIDNHVQAYGVILDMYPAFFQAMHSVVRNSLGKKWNSSFEAAWSARIAHLLEAINTEAESAH